jgi:hypothetical protein
MTTFKRRRRLQTYSFGCSWRILVPGTRHVERPQRGRSGFSLVGISIQKNNRYAVKGLGHEMDWNFVDMHG